MKNDKCQDIEPSPCLSLYKIGDYSFHGEAVEDGYDENAVETLDNISADNELGEERIGVVDALNALKRYFDINDSEVSSLSGEYAPSNMKFSSRDTAFSKALTAEEWKKYNNAITSGVDAGLRINDRSMLVECEKGDYSYKLVIYDNEIEDKPIKAVYGIAKSNQPTTNNNFDEKTIAEYITELEDRDYDNKRVLERLLKSVSKNVGRVLGRYSGGSNGFVRYGREISQSGGNSQNQSDRGRISKTDTQSVKSSERGDTDSRTLLANALETAATSEAKTQNREQNERRQTPLFLYSHHFPL